MDALTYAPSAKQDLELLLRSFLCTLMNAFMYAKLASGTWTKPTLNTHATQVNVSFPTLKAFIGIVVGVGYIKGSTVRNTTSLLVSASSQQWCRNARTEQQALRDQVTILVNLDAPIVNREKVNRRHLLRGKCRLHHLSHQATHRDQVR